MRNWFCTPPLTLALLGVACSSADDVAPETPARPVTVLELRSEIPRGELLATGVVEPYRRSDIGFEVGGRILGMVDPGQELAGPLLDADGQLLLDGDGNPRREGDVVAVLDDTRYRQAVEACEDLEQRYNPMASLAALRKVPLHSGTCRALKKPRWLLLSFVKTI